jgi:3-oxoacyl-[acyl-carrier protein] reductase
LISGQLGNWLDLALNVIVTGTSRGLGLGIAQRLTAVGYSVIAVARRQGEQLASVMRDVDYQRTGSLHFRPFDLGNLSGISDFVRELRNEFGAIYGLINNAGLGTSGILATMPNAQILRVVQLNTVSPLILTKYVVRSMMSQGDGRIVNIASILVSTGYNGLSVYGATKASLVGFTRSLAREIGPLGITVNAVAPGFIETEMTQGLGDRAREQIVQRSALRRLAEVDDVASAVEFLLGQKAKNITGSVLTVDAGNTA